MLRQTKKTTPVEELRNALRQQPKDALVEILIAQSKTDRNFKIALTSEYVPSDKEAESAIHMMKKRIAGAGIGEILTAASTGKAIVGIKNVLESAAGKKNAVQAVKLYAAVVGVVVEKLPTVDDTETFLALADNALGEIKRIVAEKFTVFSEYDKDIIFDTLFLEGIKPCYDGYDEQRFTLFDCCVAVCTCAQNRERLDSFIKHLRSVMKKNPNEYQYALGRTLLLRLALITAFDGEAEAEAYVNKHIADNEEFKTIAINSAVGKRDYSRVYSLASESDNAQWRKHAFWAAKCMGDTVGMKRLSRALVLNGEFEYYIEYKCLFDKADWDIKLEELLTELNTKKEQKQLYKKIIVAEEKQTRICDFIEENKEFVWELYKYAGEDNHARISKIMREELTKAAASADTRRDYGRICEQLGIYGGYAGVGEADLLKEEIKAANPRKHAFIGLLGE